MDLCLFILINKRHQISYRIYYVLVRGKLCVQKVVFVLNKTSLVRNSVPVKEISLATTPIRTLLQTTVMKKLIHTIFVIKYDSSCFPIVTVWFLFVWVFLTECSTDDLLWVFLPDWSTYGVPCDWIVASVFCTYIAIVCASIP